jgi:prepilin-type N-terminal cleavage/methylation domain-containing protein
MPVNQKTMHYKQRTYKAFTLVELLVAIGLLAIVISFAGVIFRVSINAHRTAMANAEIMQKLRAITEQLNADFKGVIRTYRNKLDIQTRNVNSDSMVFFANGDFQSVGQYKYLKSDGTYAHKTVHGNVASIYYGQAADPNPNVEPSTDPFVGDPRQKILVRRQTILTSDRRLNGSNPIGEFYISSLSESYVDPNLDVDALIVRPTLDPHLEQDLPMYMAKGVDNFTIEWSTGDINSGQIQWQRSISGPLNIVTKAFKFTFTLYDSKGIIKEGRTFTHIVYLD